LVLLFSYYYDGPANEIDMGKDRFKFDVIGEDLKKGSTAMMREIAMAQKNYFVASFKRQDWDGEKWQEVQRRIKGTKPYEYPKKKGLKRRSRPILVGRGSLRRAVNSSLKSVTPNRVRFEVDLPYAAIHNEGLRMKNGGLMPKRQFMGLTEVLNKTNKKIIQKYVDKAFKR
jgi:phage gpG-like protein